MGAKTNIEWTEATWNPVTGCTAVSPGCDHCYAESIAHRFAGTAAFPDGFAVTLRPERLDQPLRWTRPRRIFVCSMADLFHDQVPDEHIAEVFAVMALAPRHTFQVLTKRHGRMRSLLAAADFRKAVAIRAVARAEADAGPPYLPEHLVIPPHGESWWPLANVWLGVSAEDQKRADLRIPALLDTPAAVRWVSAEPLLGPISLEFVGYFEPNCRGCSGLLSPAHEPSCGVEPGRHWGLDWVVAGGESGRGARPMHPDWARALRDQCAAAGVPFLFKQWGEHVPATVEDDPAFAGGRAFSTPGGGRMAVSAWDRDRMLDADTIALRVGKKAAGRELDGVVHDGYPAAVSA
jgi:protein gp37